MEKGAFSLILYTVDLQLLAMKWELHLLLMRLKVERLFEVPVASCGVISHRHILFTSLSLQCTAET